MGCTSSIQTPPRKESRRDDLEPNLSPGAIGELTTDCPVVKVFEENKALLRFVDPLVNRLGIFLPHELCELTPEEHNALGLSKVHIKRLEELARVWKPAKGSVCAVPDAELLLLPISLVCKGYGLNAISQPMMDNGAVRGADLALLLDDKNLYEKVTKELSAVPLKRLRTLAERLSRHVHSALVEELTTWKGKPINDMLVNLGMGDSVATMELWGVEIPEHLSDLDRETLKKEEARMKPIEYLRLVGWAAASKEVTMYWYSRTKQKIPPPSKTLSDLPKIFTTMDDGMPKALKDFPVRLVKISSLLGWDRLVVYEDFAKKMRPDKDYVEIPYGKITTATWLKLFIVTWRWAESKPSTPVSDFSPMSLLQLKYLKEQLRDAMESGAEYVWVDWCCVPQSSESPMTEIMRSRLFYARALGMSCLPNFKKLPEGPVAVVLKQVLRALQSARSDDSEHEARTMAAFTLEILLKSGWIAARDYFGRVWTLVERMARAGRGEKLQNWMSLELWLGMVVDALLSSTIDRDASAMYWENLFSADDLRKLDNILGLLNDQIKEASTAVDSEMVEDIASLFVSAVHVWENKEMDEEPNEQWLRRYLESEALIVYQAFDPYDVVWAVLQYFFQKDISKDDFGTACKLLCKRAGAEHMTAELLNRIEAEVAKRKAIAEQEAAKPRVAEQEAAKRRLADQEAAKRRLAEQEAAKRRLAEQEAAKRRLAEQEAAKRRLAEQEAAKRQLADQEAAKRRLADQEAAKRQLAEQEAAKRRLAEQEAAKRQLAEQEAAKRQLAEQEAAKTKQRDPALLLNAARRGDLAEVQEELLAKTDVDSIDENGQTPLHAACLCGHHEVAALLLDRGAQVDKPNRDGYTPLIIACWSGHKEVAALLLDGGAQVDKNKDGFTPLRAARLKGHKEVEALLLQHGAR